MKTLISTLIAQSVEALRSSGLLPADMPPIDFVVERPKTREHGDFATNAAMQLAKASRKNPRMLAQQLIEHLPPRDDILRIEMAGPGFINFYLAPSAYHRELAIVLKKGRDYGRNASGQSRNADVEYVSANPTGPLHVGHGRAAAIGDTLARLLTANGWNTKREFYYNDAGVQIDALTRSVQARLHGLKPEDAQWPQDGYCGEYIQDIARAYVNGDTIQIEGRALTGSGNINDLDAIRQFAVAYLRNEQNHDLAAFGVDFDIYYLESSLYTDGKVEETVRQLIGSGHTYEQDGALWLRTTDFGDDKDRVMRKSDGTYTYFVPDIAYHLTKWQRGYVRAITELGADHHGSLARVRAGLQALNVGIPPNWPEYVLHQMVTVTRGGKEVKIGKRAGDYITLRDLIEEVGRDATRWFLIARKPDSQLIFDVDLARQQNNDNPVYYVQYAHARIASIRRHLEERNFHFQLAQGLASLPLLKDTASLFLMVEISRWPEIVAIAGQSLEPHLITQYLRELAYAFHSWYWYPDNKILVDDTEQRNARLALAIATQHVIANGLELLGIRAPEKM